MNPACNQLKVRTAVIAVLIAVISFCGPQAFGQDGRKCLWTVSSGRDFKGEV